MEDYKDQLVHLKEMRSIMERSNKFLSLSGLSGILCGTYALVAAGIAYYFLYVYPSLQDFTLIDQVDMEGNRFTEAYATVVAMYSNIEFYLILLGSVTLLLSIGTALLLSKRKAKKQDETLWNPSFKIMLTHLLIPLISGGLFGLICIYKGWLVVIAPITLIFYGLALVSAAKFTFGEILYLGVLQVLLGLTCMFFLGYSLFFWAFGFGVLHIIYGLVIHRKYERT
ncbi:MAG TPA: hypothetical protein VK177_17835 [Flavobacteriales bacterium]|nr:hypothetical protein [Flavobacteriales bacterium]